MFRGIHRTSVQVVDIIRHVGTELSQLQILIWSILDSEIKTKAKIQKYFQYTSSVEYPWFCYPSEPVLASLVVESKSYCKFFLPVILSLIVDS